MERGGRVADYILHLTQEENVVLGADTVRREFDSQNRINSPQSRMTAVFFCQISKITLA